MHDSPLKHPKVLKVQSARKLKSAKVMSAKVQPKGQTKIVIDNGKLLFARSMDLVNIKTSNMPRSTDLKSESKNIQGNESAI